MLTAAGMDGDADASRLVPPDVEQELQEQVERHIRRWRQHLLVNFGGRWQRLPDWQQASAVMSGPSARDALLRDIAGRLWTAAREYVPRVLPDRLDGAPHPLGHFILAQGEKDPSRFQLPEPLLGPVGDTTQVLVVGLNPGYSIDEAIPRLGDSLEHYVAWYASRLSPARRDQWERPIAVISGVPRVVRHYASVERDYLRAFGQQPLGRVAVYVDAIPWKWNAEAHPDFRDPAVIRYARERVAEIAAGLQPGVLITLGLFAADCLGIPRPAVEPEVSERTIGAWAGACLPLFHPNKRWAAGARAHYIAAVHGTLIQALR